MRAKREGGGWGEWTRAVYQVTGSLLDPIYMGDEKNTSTTPAIIGAVVAVIILLLLIFVIVMIYVRRSSEGWSDKQQVGDFDGQEYRGISPHYTTESGLGIVQTHTGVLPLFNTLATHKTYIDPHTYEDPHQAVRQFAKELVSCQITSSWLAGCYKVLFSRILATSLLRQSSEGESSETSAGGN